QAAVLDRHDELAGHHSRRRDRLIKGPGLVPPAPPKPSEASTGERAERIKEVVWRWMLVLPTESIRPVGRQENLVAEERAQRRHVRRHLVVRGDAVGRSPIRVLVARSLERDFAVRLR